MSAEVVALADRLVIHPYLAALGYALVHSDSESERDFLFAVWLTACDRYGIDLTIRAELLRQIKEPP